MSRLKRTHLSRILSVASTKLPSASQSWLQFFCLTARTHNHHLYVLISLRSLLNVWLREHTLLPKRRVSLGQTKLNAVSEHRTEQEAVKGCGLVFTLWYSVRSCSAAGVFPANSRVKTSQLSPLKQVSVTPGLGGGGGNRGTETSLCVSSLLYFCNGLTAGKEVRISMEALMASLNCSER